MFRQIGILLMISMGALTTVAQDTLPKFTLVNKGNGRIIISWTSPYKSSVHQLSIQRSFDSTHNFKTILTLPDPTVPQNGYVDTKAPTEHMFYRLFILLDSGKYVFSPAKRPILDTAKTIAPPKEQPKLPEERIQETPKPEPVKPNTQAPVKPVETKNNDVAQKAIADSIAKRIEKPKEIPERIIYVKKRDTLIAQVGERSLKRFKDSIAYRTRDTLSFNSPDTIDIRPF